MKNIMTIAFCLMALFSQAQKADTSTLAVFNTGRNFTVTAADFGSTPTQDLIGEMVMAFDTIMVLKAHTKADSSGKKPMRHQMERSALKMSSNLKDKIAVIDFNKDYDVTQMSINVQKAGAKALVIIHESDDKKVYKLTKKGVFKDSIRIPVYTLPYNKGGKITELLPSVVGIKVTNPQLQSLLANTQLDIDAQADFNKSRIEWVSNTSDKNDFFILEKLNAKTGQFEGLETLNSNHTGSLEQHVSFDVKPDDGENYYRIQLVQLDGSVLFSAIKMVNFSVLQNVTIFPNPVESEINIALKGYTSQAVDFVLYDMQGKPVLTEHIGSLQTPVHTLSLQEKTPTGQYMLIVKTQGKRDVIKMVTVGK
jgi:Secretion system C-terminal sorting domain/PA domain